jgi:hypothetical protein
LGDIQQCIKEETNNELPSYLIELDGRNIEHVQRSVTVTRQIDIAKLTPPSAEKWERKDFFSMTPSYGKAVQDYSSQGLDHNEAVKRAFEDHSAEMTAFSALYNTPYETTCTVNEMEEVSSITHVNKTTQYKSP